MIAKVRGYISNLHVYFIYNAFYDLKSLFSAQSYHNFIFREIKLSVNSEIFLNNVW